MRVRRIEDMFVIYVQLIWRDQMKEASFNKGKGMLGHFKINHKNQNHVQMPAFRHLNISASLSPSSLLMV